MAMNGNDDTPNVSIQQLYTDVDKGPYVTYLELIEQNGDDQVLDDVSVGKLLLMDLKIENIQNVKRIGRFKCKITFDTKEGANSFLKCKALKEKNLKTYIPIGVINKTGIIYAIPTEHDDKFLMDNIESELEILNVFRFNRTVTIDGNKKQIPTGTVKITFRGQVLPREIKLLCAKKLVKPFIPKVIQCFKCLKFGHTQSVCKQKEATCEMCSTVHPAGECGGVLKCFHCKSPEHASKDKSCPEFMRQQIIKEVMMYYNISYVEANEAYPMVVSWNT